MNLPKLLAAFALAGFSVPDHRPFIRPYDVLTTPATEEKMRRAREEDSRRRQQKAAERKARRA